MSCNSELFKLSLGALKVVQAPTLHSLSRVTHFGSYNYQYDLWVVGGCSGCRLLHKVLFYVKLLVTF